MSYDALDEHGLSMAQEAVDYFDVQTFADARLAAQMANPENHTPGWFHAAEFLMHPLNPENLETELREYVQSRASHYPVVETYSLGCIRDTAPLTAEQQDALESRPLDTSISHCYTSAQTQVGRGLEYVEGFVTLGTNPRPIPHGWLEYEGKVVDLALGDRPDSEAVYWGIEYNEREVYQAISDRGEASPLATEPDTYPPRQA